MMAAAAVGLVQAPAPTGRIDGQIVEARTGSPLAAVLVQVQGTRLQALSDTDGAFTITDVPAGHHLLVVSVVGFGRVRRDVDVSAGATSTVTIPIADGASTYVEDLTVSGSTFPRAEPSASSESVLTTRDLLALRGVLADDPFRAVQTLPGVATGDDFRGEFAVRGLGPQHIGIAVDGVDSPFLFHTVRAVNDTGSLALINSDVLQDAVLLPGPHPQKLGAHLGARVDFTTREGARDAFASRLMVSGSAATGIFEGPIGGERRGSWLLAARRSYIDWLLTRIDPEIDGRFGFTDVQGGVAYDLTTRQQLRVTFIAGHSLLHDRDDDPSLNSLERGGTTSGIVNLRWRFTPSARLVVQQQVYAVRNRYVNKVVDGRAREEGWDRDLTWRGSADWRPSESLAFEAGGDAQLLRARRVERRFTSAAAALTTLDASLDAANQAGYIASRWVPARHLSIAAGLRAQRFGAADDTAAAPWLTGEWRAHDRLRLRAGLGIQYQSPALDDVLLAREGTMLRAERARSAELGAEQRIGANWRASVTAYHRADRDRLRVKNAEFRLLDRQLIRPGTPYVDNVLRGRTYGIDATVERRSANGFTGWLAYSWGRAELTDESGTITGAAASRVTDETYPADYDQRHTLNAYAGYRWSARTSVSSRLRYGSNFPITAYVSERGSEWVVAAERSRARLPAYARVDVRADRAFVLGSRRLTLFVEVINALNRDNVRPQAGALNVASRTVTGLTERVFPFLPSAGVLVEF